MYHKMQTCVNFGYPSDWLFTSNESVENNLWWNLWSIFAIKLFIRYLQHHHWCTAVPESHVRLNFSSSESILMASDWCSALPMYLHSMRENYLHHLLILPLSHFFYPWSLADMFDLWYRMLMMGTMLFDYLLFQCWNLTNTK